MKKLLSDDCAKIISNEMTEYMKLKKLTDNLSLSISDIETQHRNLNQPICINASKISNMTVTIENMTNEIGTKKKY